MAIASPATVLGAEPRVELELVQAGGAALTAAQRWLPVLDEVGFSQPRIRALQEGDRLEIVNVGTADNPNYKVCGILTAGGDIKLPGGRQFSFRDRGALSNWVRNLKAQGPEATDGGPTPFGITPSRLVAVRKDLSQPLTAATRGQQPATVLDAVSHILANAVVIDDEVRRTLAASGAVRDELQGLSCGTALAALVRPAGLVLRPRFAEGRVQYAIVDARGEAEYWPIGWSSEKSPGQLIPGLFEREETQEVEVSLGPALTELRGRVKAPFLFDYNNLALKGVNLAETMVKMKAGKNHYARVLSRVLSQAKLTYETRVDDAGTAFLWITTAKH